MVKVWQCLDAFFIKALQARRNQIFNYDISLKEWNNSNSKNWKRLSQKKNLRFLKQYSKMQMNTLKKIGHQVFLYVYVIPRSVQELMVQMIFNYI